MYQLQKGMSVFQFTFEARILFLLKHDNFLLWHQQHEKKLRKNTYLISIPPQSYFSLPSSYLSPAWPSQASSIACSFLITSKVFPSLSPYLPSLSFPFPLPLRLSSSFSSNLFCCPSYSILPYFLLLLLLPYLRPSPPSYPLPPPPPPLALQINIALSLTEL